MKQPARVIVLVLMACLALAAAAPGRKQRAPSSAKPPAPAPAPESKGDPAAGKKLFQANCAICHFADASIAKVGPGMKDLFKREKLALNSLPVTEENVRKVMDAGVGDPAMPRMPAYRDLLTRKEKDDLIAYLKTL